MIRSSIRFSLALLLAVCGAASSEELPGRRPGPNEREGRIRRVEGARHDRRHELKPIARPGLGEGDTTWLLSPQVFSKLSSAGRRRALALNGLLPSARSTSSTFAPQAREAVAVTPFANVRVNDPARDEVGHTQSEAWVAASGRSRTATRACRRPAPRGRRRPRPATASTTTATARWTTVSAQSPAGPVPASGRSRPASGA